MITEADQKVDSQLLIEKKETDLLAEDSIANSHMAGSPAYDNTDQALQAVYDEFCALDSDGSGKLHVNDVINIVDSVYNKESDQVFNENLKYKLQHMDLDEEDKLSWEELRVMISEGNQGVY